MAPEAHHHWHESVSEAKTGRSRTFISGQSRGTHALLTLHCTICVPGVPQSALRIPLHWEAGNFATLPSPEFETDGILEALPVYAGVIFSRREIFQSDRLKMNKNVDTQLIINRSQSEHLITRDEGDWNQSIF